MVKRYSEEELFDLAKRHLASNYAPFPVVVKNAQGCWVWDIRGKKYFDMLSGYSALNFGHSHPRIVHALKEQCNKLAVFPRAFLSEELVLFGKELAEFCNTEMALPMNSGAEAVETAIKLSRKWAYRVKGVPIDQAEIIVCDNNFHGRTTTIISFSSEPQYKDLFGPLTPGFVSVPYGNHEAFLNAITLNTAAFLVEPIQGEGGIVVPPDDYLKKCREICRDNKILFLADEIQTGLGRTGEMFACDHSDVTPDIFILGKALGGGVLPVSAIAGPRKILEVFEPGDHGSTFGGNPLACHVAREALKILDEERLDQKTKKAGGYLMEKLRTMNSPHVKEVRGKGLLIGIELKETGPTAREMCEKLVENGIICNYTRKYVIRIAPPLIATKAELDWALKRIKKVLTGA